MSNSKNINLSLVFDKAQHYAYIPNDVDLRTLASNLNIPQINNLLLKFFLQKEGSNYVFQGYLVTDLKQLCSISGEELSINLKIDITRKYKVINKDNVKNGRIDKKYIYIGEIPDQIDDEDIDMLDNYSLNCLELIQEELFLNINPYIKK